MMLFGALCASIFAKAMSDNAQLRPIMCSQPFSAHKDTAALKVARLGFTGRAALSVRE
jgi:hypothetical protein